MPKELYLYSPVYDFVAQDLISKMEEAGDEDVTMRINSPGGSVFSGWGIIAKMQERKGKTNIKVDGAAMSMAAFIPLFADHVEALDTSTFMLHRAAMYVETPEDQAVLDKVNKNLRSKMETKLDSDALKSISGYSIKDLFENEKRIDLFLTAKEAKQIGLVDKINKVSPKELAAFNEKFYSLAAKSESDTTTQTNKSKTNKMTLAQLKAEHLELFNEVVAIGVAAEKDRVEACLVFNDIDPKGVKAAIEGGKPLTEKQKAEFGLKAMGAAALKNISADSEGKELTTEEITAKNKTAKEQQIAEFNKELFGHLGLNTKK
jgi:ATP-dependent protease ClpP protease subunit